MITIPLGVEGWHSALVSLRVSYNELASQIGRVDYLDYSSNGVPMAAKTTCPITRQQFSENAKPVEVVINGIPMSAEVKEFSTGSLGWYLNGKMSIKVGDTSVTVQIGMNMTIVGSKELPKEGA